MFFPEHSHIPVSRATDYPDSYGGGVLPDFYKRTYDPFISCSFAAAATTTLEVGTGICLLALRDAVHTAKLVASVDRCPAAGSRSGSVSAGTRTSSSPTERTGRRGTARCASRSP